MVDYRSIDVPGLYRINVQEIVDNWAGYPLKNPCIPEEAQNSGKIQIRCFINNQCPFMETNPKDDALVFNEETLINILPSLPDSFRNVLRTTPDLEGMYIAPRYVFRHNYLYQPIFSFSNLSETDYESFLSENNFNRNYEEIEEGRGNFNFGGAESVREAYKKEQSWIIERSIFDDPVVLDSEGECIRSRWIYENRKESESEFVHDDILHDYDINTYLNYLYPNDDEIPDGVQFNRVLFNPQITRTLRQTRTYDDSSTEGIHWRVRKRTPLFKGEDFFIKFYKTAKSSTGRKENTSIPPFKLFQYDFLDIMANRTIAWDENFPELTKTFVNSAVRPSPNIKEEQDDKPYDFSSQAYYVVELGYKDPINNYFIIINERTNPVCINVQKGVSIRMGEFFGGVSGKQLIDLEYFTMTVRNHLGMLVVEFEGPGLKTEPWIIQKEELEINVDRKSNTYTTNTKPSLIFVPRGQMTIWGGNLSCGFVFGPLQYAVSQAGFTYPPSDVDGSLFTANDDGNINLSSSIGGDDPESTVSPQIIHPQPFFLPMGVNHRILLSSPDIDRYEFEKEIGGNRREFIRDNRNIKVSMFSQDAQFYREYYETADRRTRIPDQYGAFYYKETLKEIGLTAETSTPAKTSGLTVFKYRYLNDLRSRQQAFDMIIHMLVGDHVFNLNGLTSYNEEDNLYDTGQGKGQWDVIQHTVSNLNDNEWFLADCKTPILTGIRLKSDAGFLPRWDDGTVIFTGVAATPFDNNSPYFVDATDHVLEFNDSWGATDFTQIEHNGTISFLLNKSMPYANNIVSDQLFSLQNKTFYIEIWAGYDPCSYSRVSGFYKLFTGLCYGGKIRYEYGKQIMDCEVRDYTAVLENILFFNSPFFDGQRDINAVNDILKLAGFRNTGVFDPGSLINNLANYSDSNNSATYFHHIDGRLFKMETFTLPSAYNRLDQPMFKFDDGSSFMDGIKDISKKAAKVFYFDQLGIAHYEDFGDMIEQDFLGRIPLDPLYKFTTNPEINPGQLVFNALSRYYVVSDIYNHIKMMSNTPDLHLLLYDNLNWDSMENPEIEGFIGHMKTFYQQEGLFGSRTAVLHAARKYSVMFRPAIMYNFETYGVPLRANDIIEIDGETARVVKVDHNLNAAENKWWMTVECKRYQPIV